MARVRLFGEILVHGGKVGVDHGSLRRRVVGSVHAHRLRTIPANAR
jgi:hypothetical protein